MSRFELSLSKDYVADWTLEDAMRELFQNAIDHHSEDEGNTMSFSYSDDGVFTISNKTSILETSTLLLGVTTKRDNPGAIGQFGEGYKIATLVLTRLGKEVVIYNYGRREVWTARFVNSRRYGTEILTFFVESHAWEEEPDNWLEIEVHGITEDEYDSIADTNLYMQDGVQKIETSYGSILLDDDLRGKVFVNGLYVSTKEEFRYGYNLNPRELTLDRDRRMVSDFDLAWTTSKMIVEGMRSSDVINLLKEAAVDVKYINAAHKFGYDSNYLELADDALNNFWADYGSNAVPVSTHHETLNLAKGYKPIVVSSELKELITQSILYKEPERIEKPKPHERLRKWFREYGQDAWKKVVHIKEVDEAFIQLEQILIELEEEDETIS